MCSNSLVSVVMPTYNAESTVSESIKSVLTQSYINWELIIVDDNSSDATWEIIESYSEKHDNIHTYQNTENLGAGASRNLAIEKANGRFIAFLDSDDLWTEDKLSEQIPFMIENEYPLTYTHYTRFNSSRELNVVTAPLSTTYTKVI